LAKRAALLQSPAHLVELGLLRGGERLAMEEPLPSAAYYVFISHAEHRPDCGVWPIQIQERLPRIPVPLSGSETVPLDLETVLKTIYSAAAYADMLHYEHGAEPPLSPPEAAWAEALLAGARSQEGLSERG
jgi:hypothetical protein